MGFEVVQIRDFGDWTVGFNNLSKQISAGPRGFYAIEVDPSSEIDMCFVTIPGYSSVGGLYEGDPGYFIGGLPPASKSFKDSIILSVEHPIIVPHVMGTILIHPYYLYRTDVVVNSLGMFPHATMSLRLWREPPPISIERNQRAVIRGGGSNNGGGTGYAVMVPTFGRKLLRIHAINPSAQSISIDYSWSTPDFSRTDFGTGTPIVVPASPGVLSYTTQSIANWMTVHDDGINPIQSVIVEAYD